MFRSAKGKGLRWTAVFGALVVLVAAVGACAGDEEIVAQQPQAPAPAAQPRAAAAAAEPQPAHTTAAQARAVAGVAQPGRATRPAPAADVPAPSRAAEEQFKVFPQDGMPRYGGVFHTPLNDLSTLSPLEGFPAPTGGMLAKVYDTLTWWDWRSGHKAYQGIGPSSAKSWDVSDDFTEYTFHLRDNLRFHDGSPLTSADVKVSLDHLLDPGKYLPNGVGYFRPFAASVEAPDRLTVVVKLKAPNALFLPTQTISWVVIVPKKYLDEKGIEWFRSHTMGSGPYRFIQDEWRRGIGWAVERNPDYWEEGIPYLDKIQALYIPDGATRVAAFETKRLDQLNRIENVANPTAIQKILDKYGNAINKIEFVGPGQRYVHFNARQPPLNDPRVRRAIYLWLDRQEFLQKTAFGQGYLGDWIHPQIFRNAKGEPYGTPFKELVKSNPAYNPDKTEARKLARQLLAEAGYTDLSKVKLRLVPQGRGRSGARDNTILAGQLKQMGFDAYVDPLEGLHAVQAFRSGEYGGGYYSGGNQHSFPEPLLNSYLAADAQRNYTGIRDPTFEKLLADLNGTIDQKKRDRLMADIDEYLQQGTYPMVLLYWTKTIVLEQAYVHGKKYLNQYTKSRDDHIWLGPGAPGRK